MKRLGRVVDLLFDLSSLTLLDMTVSPVRCTFGREQVSFYR